MKRQITWSWTSSKFPIGGQVELCKRACSLADFGEIHPKKANSFRRFRFKSRPRFAKPPIVEES